eukprot:TRINITY_DN8938_c0_g3_i1.p1 TRINITY_DN8938_c0_g3~~TRINITY_DN8938_c0_g3_i1.p1  ORF type:complete len:175 (+),score=45.58 TRINITY_DN8938_c0_g3_i1:154-678(+)
MAAGDPRQHVGHELDIEEEAVSVKAVGSAAEASLSAALNATVPADAPPDSFPSLASMFLLVMLSAPLRKRYGAFWTIMYFNIGMVLGAMLSVDGGGSGGNYCLLGIHIAHLGTDWHKHKFRAATILFLSFLVFVDWLCFYLGWQKSYSHSAHLVGVGTGGMIVGAELFIFKKRD